MAAALTPFETWRSSQVEEADDTPLLDAFATLLAPGSTIPAAASAIAETTSTAILALPDSDAEVPLWRLFRWTSKLAQGVPDAHERLIRLLIALRGTPPLERIPGGGQVLVWGVRRVWNDLPMLGPAMVEAYNQLSPYEADQDGDGNSTRLAFLNLTAFLARCTAASPPLLDFSSYAFMALSTLFPLPSPTSQSEEAASRLEDIHAWVPAIHRWLAFAGRRMFIALDDTPREPEPTEAAGEEPINTPGRWESAKAGLKEVEEDGGVCVDVRTLARTAREDMEASQG